MTPKVLVGCPTAVQKKYCLKEYAEGIKGLDYENFDVLVADNSPTEEYAKEIEKTGLNTIKDQYFEKVRDRIINSRNLLRKKTIDEEYDYFFSLEQDVFPQKDTIKNLLEHGKDIVTGIVMAAHNVNGQNKVMPMVWVQSNELGKMRYATKEELQSARLLEIFACSLSCVMISRKALEKIEFRYEGEAFDDIFFCEDARKNGYKIYADTKVRPVHWPVPWEGVK